MTPPRQSTTVPNTSNSSTLTCCTIAPPPGSAGSMGPRTSTSVARWGHDGGGPEGRARRWRGAGQPGPAGDRAAAGAGHGLARHGRDGLDGRAAVLVPLDVGGEPVL